MYSIYYKGKEYEVSEKLFLNICLCMLQFEQASIIDKPDLIEASKKDVFLRFLNLLILITQD